MMALVSYRIAWIIASALMACTALVATAPQDRNQPARIVAIGDIHGAAAEFQEILRAAGLLDAQGRWSGGSTQFVQTGDYTDRGAGIREVLDLLMRLEQEARRANARVDVLLGNHEVMNMVHSFRDVPLEAYAAFAGSGSENRRQKALKDHTAVLAKRGRTPDADAWLKAHPPGFIEYAESMDPRGRYGRWLRDKKAIAVAGGTVFMHAGIKPDTPGSVDDINRQVQSDLRAWDEAVAAMAREKLVLPFYTIEEIVDAAGAELERIASLQQSKEPLGDHVTRDFVAHLQRAGSIGTSSLLSPEGPMWYRGLAQLPETERPQIEALLKRLGASRFVTAHTPQLPTGRITSRFGGLAILIDTGMLTSHFKGRPSALEITGGTLTAIYTDGRQPLTGH
jgi:hypothetical protein